MTADGPVGPGGPASPAAPATAERTAASGVILLVDDDPGTRKVARANLSLEGFEVITAASATEALARLSEIDPLAVVSDVKMPDRDGVTLMEEIHALNPSVPVVLVSGHATIENAVAAMRRGALHYLTKPIRYDELALILRHAVASERARRELLALRGELERAAGFEEMVGASPEMRQVFAMVEQIAPTDATVLIRGETGTGKELVARAIHRRSTRSERTFVGVNCSAVPRELIESEFFGHEKGAFTGATARRVGRFEQADGSTLFLDEVGELDLGVQAKLLRVLQEKEITRVGSERTTRVDVRIIAATNQPLEELVRAGRFREDLYYRLNVIPIRLPTLRERPADLPLLMQHFLRSFAARYGKEPPAAPPDLLAAAREYPWPGNVRELRNVCERVILIGWAAVSPLLVTGTARAPSSLAAFAEMDAPLLEARAALVERFEREYLVRLLQKHRGKIGEVARAAGIAERNLYEKMKQLGLSRDDYR